MRNNEIMSNAVYLTRSVAFDHVLAQFENCDYQEIKVLCAWTPSEKLISFLNILPNLFFMRDHLLSRPIKVRIESNSSRISIDTFRNIELLTLSLNILSRGKISNALFRLREKIIQNQAQSLSKTANFIISTDDFPIHEWSTTEYALEYRGIPEFIQAEQFRTLYFQDFNLPYRIAKNSMCTVSKLNSEALKYVIVYSIFVKQQIQKLHDFKKPIKVLSLSRPRYQFEIIKTRQPRLKQLLFIGRDDPRKGLDFALKLSKITGYRLTVAGSYSPEYVRVLRQLPFVDFRGSMNRSQLFTLMGQIGILLAPSIETYGYSIAEAIDLKMNVIASQYAGVTEQLIPSEHIAILKNFDLEQWSTEIGRSFSNLMNRTKVIDNES